MLKSSDPQNRMRSGSVDFVDTCCRGYIYIYNVLYVSLARYEILSGFGNSCCMAAIACKSPAFERI